MLSSTRTYHMSGPNPIQLVEIEAYMRLMRVNESPEYRLLFLRLILRMDATLISFHADRRAAEEEAKRLRGAMAVPKR